MQKQSKAVYESAPAICRNVGIKKMCIGGQNEDWETPKVELLKVSCRMLLYMPLYDHLAHTASVCLFAAVHDLMEMA